MDENHGLPLGADYLGMLDVATLKTRTETHEALSKHADVV
jgi:hypothetical protein